MSQGNSDQSPGHGGLQIFAFDFSTDGYDPNNPHRVRAARGGRVVLLKESASTNQAACYDAGGTTGSPCDDGNYLYIRHQDGTYATYWHMPHDGVFPAVGDVVHRSDEIALSDNTGRSYGNHVHFHVQTTNGVDTSSSIRIRFQTQTSTCFIPPDEDESESNNEPSLFY